MRETGGGPNGLNALLGVPHLPLTDLQYDAWEAFLEDEEYRPSRADYFAAQTAMWVKVGHVKAGTAVSMAEMTAPKPRPRPSRGHQDGGSESQVDAREKVRYSEVVKAARVSPDATVTTLSRDEMAGFDAAADMMRRGREERERREREGK